MLAQKALGLSSGKEVEALSKSKLEELVPEIYKVFNDE